MNKPRPFGKYFQLRWKEPLGLPECPYLYRWTFIFFGYTIRLHHWLRSDDNRYFHDHSTNLISIVLKGRYWNVTPAKEDSVPYNSGDKIMASDLKNCTHYFRSETYNYVEGVFNSFKNFLHLRNSIWYSKATKKHWLCIPKEGAWTLLLCSRPYHKWGFYVNNHKWRPLRYFHKFGIIQTKDYQ
jgi:hypothetical protein